MAENMENMENMENEGNEKVVDPNRGNGKVKKILKRIGWTIFGILVVMWAIGFFAPEFTRTMPERMGTWLQNKIDAKNQAVLDAQVEALREKYRNDFDGGNTPEETLDLLITALKAGDVEKASRYYELSVQAKALASLKEEISRKGDLHQSIKYFSDIRQSKNRACDIENIKCGFEFEYVREETSTTTALISGENIVIVSPSGSIGTKFADIEKNLYTKVWKIKQPY